LGRSWVESRRLGDWFEGREGDCFEGRVIYPWKEM
jgi:hypothetical protein